MKRTDRVLSPMILSLGVILACASPGGGPSPQSCSGEDQCSQTARCIASACVENVAPVADFSFSGDLTATSDITLDASASHDSDQDDVVASYKWEVSAAASTIPGCQAPTIASTDKTVHIVFGCAGSWDVKLVAFDKKQAASAAATKTLTIAARPGPAVVTVGEDQAIGHVCSGSPRRCTTATAVDSGSTPTAVKLSATLNSQSPLSVKWSVSQRPSGRDAATVSFDDPSSLTPEVTIATDGTAISGDWVFRVEALNGTTVVGSAVTRVSVGNRPPVIAHGALGEIAHKYDTTTKTYSASGILPLQITDPDGDDVTSGVTSNQVNAGASTFQASLDGSNLMVSIFAGTNPLWLRGPSDLSRTVTVKATDSNGEVTTEVLPMVVGNNEPKVTEMPSSYRSANHRFDSAAKAYVASPAVAFVSDPDGDPMAVTSFAGRDCGDPHLSLYGGSDDTYSLFAKCSKPFSSISDLSAFVGSRGVTATVSDSWGGTTVSSAVTLLDSAPTAATPPTYSAGRSCTLMGCDNGSSAPQAAPQSYTFTWTSAVKDPDGDPLQLTSADGISIDPSAGTSPTFWFTLPTQHPCSNTPTSQLGYDGVPFAITDGVTESRFQLTVHSACQW